MDHSIITSAILGAIQGLTEFLPVSSSGHLTIFQHLFGLQDPEANLALDILLHSATLIAVIWFFRSDLMSFASSEGRAKPGNRHLALMIAIASIPTAVIGVGFKKQFEAMFAAPLLVCGALIVTGILLLAAHRRSKNQAGKALSELTLGQAVFIGIMQGIAVTPGISRSGTTIAAGIFSGLKGEEAGRFSFLLMIISVGGATLLESRKLFGSAATIDWTLLPLAAGWLTSLVVGLLSLSLLMMVLKKQNLQWFAFYLLLAGPFFAWHIQKSPPLPRSSDHAAQTDVVQTASGTVAFPDGGPK